MERLVRLAIAVLALGLVVPVAPSNASPAARSEPDVILKGQTTITAPESGGLVFRLDKKVKFVKDFHMHVDGGGRVFGFMFRKAGGEFMLDPSVEALRTGFCLERGCTPKRWNGFAWGFGFERYLPAGDYELYVLADGAPLTVTFTIDGAPGRASATTTPIPSEVRAIVPTISESEEGQIYSGGAYSRIDESDISFFAMWALDHNDVATAFGDCAYNRGPVMMIPEDAAFLPGCPTGESGSSINQGPNGGTVLTYADYGGAEGLGGWFAAGNSHADYGAVAAWLDI